MNMRIALLIVAVMSVTTFGIVLTSKVIDSLNSIEHLAEISPDRFTGDELRDPVEILLQPAAEPASLRNSQEIRDGYEETSSPIRLIPRLHGTGTCDRSSSDQRT